MLVGTAIVLSALLAAACAVSAALLGCLKNHFAVVGKIGAKQLATTYSLLASASQPTKA